MGYLSDNIPLGRSVAECPELYPFALVVDYVVNDPFFSPGPVSQITLAIKEVLPDIETWQLSVTRPNQNRLKLRFRNEGERDIANAALSNVEFSVAIRQQVFQNSPDTIARGIA